MTRNTYEVIESNTKCITVLETPCQDASKPEIYWFYIDGTYTCETRNNPSAPSYWRISDKGKFQYRHIDGDQWYLERTADSVYDSEEDACSALVDIIISWITEITFLEKQS